MLTLKLDGKAVRIRMIEQGIKSQAELAERAGLSEQTVVSVLGGHGLRLETLGKLAQALSTDPARLLIMEEDHGKAPHVGAPAFTTAC